MKKLLYVLIVSYICNASIHANQGRYTEFWFAPYVHYYNAQGRIFKPKEGDSYVEYRAQRGYKVRYSKHQKQRCKSIINRDITVHDGTWNQDYKVFTLLEAVKFLAEKQQQRFQSK